MTKILITCLTVAGIVVLSSCTTVKEQEPATHTSSTTTESTSVQPAPVTTETQSVRTY
jgi:PBP1b-binding outer membrane lipoprotein LpoB